MRDKQQAAARSPSSPTTFDPYMAAAVGRKMSSPDPGIIDFGEDYLLHVECGPNQAKLYLNRLKMGSRGACVVFNNAWLTPNQFQAVSGRKTAKDWKRSIKHFGKSLKLLLAKGTLTIDPAECRCENCSGEAQEAPDLAAQLSVGSDEENVPPIRAVHAGDTPLSPRITSPAAGDISAGPENGGAAGEILGTECHPGRDKRLPPTWNVLSRQEADALREADEKQGGCGGSPLPARGTTLGGDKSCPGGGSHLAINGKSSARRGSEVGLSGIHDRASLNYSPAALAKACSAARPRSSRSPRREAGSGGDVRICHRSSSAERPPRDTTSGDVTQQQAGAWLAQCPLLEPASPLSDRELNKKQSPTKTARLTSIIEGLRKNKQETDENSDSPSDPESAELLIDTSLRHHGSSSAAAAARHMRAEFPDGTTLNPYTGALSLALLSNPLYLQSIYPYGIPKEMAAMLGTPPFGKGMIDPRLLQSPFSPPPPSSSSSSSAKKSKKERKRKRDESSSRSRSLPSSASTPKQQQQQQLTASSRFSTSSAAAEHMKYDQDGALDLSVKKPAPAHSGSSSSKTSTPTPSSESKKSRYDNTLHYFPSTSPLSSSSSGTDDGPLQRLEKLQRFAHH